MKADKGNAPITSIEPTKRIVIDGSDIAIVFIIVLLLLIVALGFYNEWGN